MILNQEMILLFFVIVIKSNFSMNKQPGNAINFLTIFSFHCYSALKQVSNIRNSGLSSRLHSNHTSLKNKFGIQQQTKVERTCKLLTTNIDLLNRSPTSQYSIWTVQPLDHYNTRNRFISPSLLRNSNAQPKYLSFLFDFKNLRVLRGEFIERNC